jgi:protein-S-isoprenylcysteine O-methyltransferase Ste14
MTNAMNAILKSRIWIAAWSVFGRAFVMLGLALLGWGLDDAMGFFANPARAGIAVIAVMLAVQAGIQIYRVPLSAKGAPHDEEHWHYSLLEIAFILSAYGDRRDVLTWNENPTLRWIGVGIYFLGFMYAAWANITWVNHLRREGEHAHEHSALLPAGPFAWTRYPVMTSLLCYHAGFTLAFRSWIGVAFILPIVYIVIRRMNLWDRTYAARYPKEWRLREQNSRRMIPFLY